jgi:glycosyltransferase involved in cell wall biosynthesis
MDPPTVSVIIPNYNHARFLPQRLESVLGQTFTDFEVLFLDDASTDESRDVFAKYLGDARVRSFFNGSNSGSTFRQWNRAALEARGRYLWFAESDDYADRELLRTLVDRLECAPSAGVAYCQSREVDENGILGQNFVEYTSDLDPVRWHQDYTNIGSDEIARFMFVKNTIPNASAVLIRRSAWDRVGGAEESMRLCGDWMLWVRILAESDLAFAAAPMNFFRHHSSSVRASRMRTLLYVWERYRIMEFIMMHATVADDLLESMSDRMADLWQIYSAEDPDAWAWHARVYLAARRVDPALHRRLFNKTLRPWLGSVKNRFKQFLHQN